MIITSPRDLVDLILWNKTPQVLMDLLKMKDLVVNLVGLRDRTLFRVVCWSALAGATLGR